MDGEYWFLRLVVPILMVVVTELIEKMHDTNEDVFPKVAKLYYTEGVTCPEFPWNKRRRLEIEKLATQYAESSKQKEIQYLN